VILNVLCVSLTKCSILAFIGRLSASTSKAMIRAITGTYLFIGLCTIGVILNMTFQCTPIEATWHVEVKLYDQYHCIATNKALVAWSVIFTVTDLWLVILPSKTVWNLTLPRRTRFGVIFLFCLGLIATGAAAFKASYVLTAYNSWDPTCKSRNLHFAT
jgi:hypothetical protein